MTPSWFFILCEISLLPVRLVSGVFLTFSDFVMRSLGGAKQAPGSKSCRSSIAKSSDRCSWSCSWACPRCRPCSSAMPSFASGAASAVIMTGGALYLVGVFVVTLVFNVPMNHRLDSLDFPAPKPPPTGRHLSAALDVLELRPRIRVRRVGGLFSRRQSMAGARRHGLEHDLFMSDRFDQAFGGPNQPSGCVASLCAVEGISSGNTARG